MKFIGDIHSHLDRISPSDYDGICVGDTGATDNFPMLWLPGNHDSAHLIETDPNCLGYFGTHNDWFYIGGAYSVDRRAQEAQGTWNPNEELDYEELQGLIDSYTIIKPRYVFSHDCPNKVAEQFLLHRAIGEYHPSRTQMALQEMLEIHAPKVWVFGHWHTSLDVEWYDTRFVCLNVCEVKEFDTEGHFC